MRGLAPLRIGLLVAMSAVFRCQKSLGIDELAGIGGRIRRQEWPVSAEAGVVVLGDIVRVNRAVGCRIICRLSWMRPQSRETASNPTGKQEAASDTNSSLAQGVGNHRDANSSESSSKLASRIG